MRVTPVIDDIIFRSGYPTFGTGHLGYRPQPSGSVLTKALPDVSGKGKKLDIRA